MKIKEKFLKPMLAMLLVLCMLVPFASACGADEVKADSVELDRATLVLEIGEEQRLTYTVFPANAADLPASWLSSDPSVATVTDGTVKGIGEGNASIRVTVGGKSASCTVTVTDPGKATVPASGITLSRQTLTLEVGGTETLTATVAPANATDKTVTWSSLQPNIATVNANGTVTALSAGTAAIEAKTSNGITASCVVTVRGESGQQSPQGLYVSKVAALEGRDDFIMCMDASAVPSLEEAGVTYKNFDGEEEDVFRILKDNGITHIRVRIWNDPNDENGHTYGGGKCDVDNAVAIAKRCKEAGLGVIIDFHYSDFWADPGKQTIPKAWKGLSTTEVAKKIGEFTKDSLTRIKATQAEIAMVQIGNETTGGLCGTTGGWEQNNKTICNYISAGSAAVREVTGSVEQGGAKVAVHFTDPQNGGYNTFAKYLKDNEVDYDVFGSSYYPYWHGTLQNLSQQLQMVHNNYGKEVMVLETSYAFTREDADGNGNTALTTVTYPITLQGQSNAVRDVIDAIASLGDWGLGIAYWEGTWIAASTSKDGATNRNLCKQYGCGWATSYASEYDSSANDGGCVIDNQAFFLSDGTPLESLKVFKLVYEGTGVDITADYIEDSEVYYTVEQGPIVLPTTVNATLNNGSELAVTVYWSVETSALEQYIKKAGQYRITGTTPYGGECVCVIWVMNPNLLRDASFEDSAGYAQTDYLLQAPSSGAWKMKYNKGTAKLQLYVSNESQNAVMGTNSFHFWDEGKVDFYLYQELTYADLSEYGSGKYGASFDIQGADGLNVEVYAYITLTYASGESKTVQGNKVGLDGWQNWNRTAVSGVEIDDTVTKIEVGIRVLAEFTGAGPWGNIDNCQLYFEEK